MARDPSGVSLEITAFRYSNYDSPFWARNNRIAGRWNLPNEHATQYLSLHPDGAWAELLRRENLRAEAEVQLVRTTIWAAWIHEGRLADYSTFEKADTAGFPPDALIDDDYARCQEEGRRLRNTGYGGIITPSAALPGVTNVVIFGRRVLSTWSVAPRLASSIPACKVAIGCPAPGLTTRARYFGDVHTGHIAFIGDNAQAHDDGDRGARVRRLDEPADDV